MPWQCQCGSSNWDDRQTCRHCGAARPSNGIETSAEEKPHLGAKRLFCQSFAKPVETYEDYVERMFAEPTAKRPVFDKWDPQSRRRQSYDPSKGECMCHPPEGWDDPGLPFVDTHCHLEALDSCYKMPVKDGKKAFNGFWERGGANTVCTVKHVLEHQPASLAALVTNCCGPLDFFWYEALAAGWDSGELQDQRLYWAVGVHPYCAKDYETRRQTELDLEPRLLALASHPRCVAVGETGLDYSKYPEHYAVQKKVFADICRLAVKLKKPLVVHARDASLDTFEILKQNMPKDWLIHLHAYCSGVPEDCKDLLDTFPNLYVGFCGAHTLKNFFSTCGKCAPLRPPGCPWCGDNPEWFSIDIDALIDTVPMERMLLETDAPYMPPNGFRGDTCQPWMAAVTARFVAMKKGVDVAELFEITNRNALRVYGIDVSDRSHQAA